MISVSIAPEPAARLSAVASIAHDLRNPLATIHGGAGVTARDYDIQKVTRPEPKRGGGGTAPGNESGQSRVD